MDLVSKVVQQRLIEINNVNTLPLKLLLEIRRAVFKGLEKGIKIKYNTKYHKIWGKKRRRLKE